jgi:hypothetical protein
VAVLNIQQDAIAKMMAAIIASIRPQAAAY